MSLVAPRPANKPPKRARFGRFLHLLARRYMDYSKLVLKAARRKRGRAVDVDHQRSKQGTGWALHWATVGRNKLHDPKGLIHKNTRIDDLSDAQIARLRGPKNQVPQRISAILRLCEEHDVRAEVELKDVPQDAYMERLMERWYVKKMNARHDLQFKTLAFIGAPHGAAARLAPVHRHGGATILTFTGFGHHQPISQAETWPVTDYVRGTAHWAA